VRAIAILVLAIFVVACDDKPQSNTGPPAGLRPVSVRIEGPAQVTYPADVQFTALQTWSDGSTRNVTASAQWTSTNPSVLSVNAGVGKALASGEVALTARVDPLISQAKPVRVMPSIAEWDGRYTLTISAGPCNSSLPLPTALRQRGYTALVRQSSLTLDVTVPGVGSFGGQILNPQARFTFFNAGLVQQRVQRVLLHGSASRWDSIRHLSTRRLLGAGLAHVHRASSRLESPRLYRRGDDDHVALGVYRRAERGDLAFRVDQTQSARCVLLPLARVHPCPELAPLRVLSAPSPFGV
jgi:hypothetical protein